MTPFADRYMKEAILTVLARSSSHIHKTNLIGREFQRGDLERHLDVTFVPEQRAQAARNFDELIRDGYVQPTWKDLIEPENWVAITSAGKDLLNRHLKDAVDLALEGLSPHLPELRRGMWDAVERSSPDAARQAAHSARELLDQLLKTGAPQQCTTRKERFKFLMKKYRMTDNVSDIDLRILDASWKLVEAEHDRLIKAAHARQAPDKNDVRASVEAAERALRLLFEK
jgi:DNA-binding PadR family transcriptional regulator